MIATTIQHNTKYISDIPFIEYAGSKFSFKQDKKFIYTKTYRKGQSGLSNKFITEFNTEWKKYIELLSAYASMDIQDENITKIHNDIITYLNEFIRSYNNNKNIIDAGEFYTGGQTTLEIKYDLVLIVNETLESRENNRLVNSQRNKYCNVNYKLEKIRLSSERW